MVRSGDAVFEVLSMDGRRVDQVRVIREALHEGDEG
jgi:hypothetical protein